MRNIFKSLWQFNDTIMDFSTKVLMGYGEMI